MMSARWTARPKQLPLSDAEKRVRFWSNVLLAAECAIHPFQLMKQIQNGDGFDPHLLRLMLWSKRSVSQANAPLILPEQRRQHVLSSMQAYQEEPLPEDLHDAVSDVISYLRSNGTSEAFLGMFTIGLSALLQGMEDEEQ